MVNSMPKNSYPELCHSSKEKTMKMLFFILLGNYYNA